MVQVIKSNTGRALWERFGFINERYYGRVGMWLSGHFISTVRLDEEMIKRSVEYQGKEDLGQAKLKFD